MSDDNDAFWAAFEASSGPSSEDGMDAEYEGQALLLQSKAVAALSALAAGQTSMVMAQLDELWALSCMEKVFCMATWVQIAGQAARTVGASLALVAGTPEGKPKTDLSAEDKVAESFMNLLLGGEPDSLEPAIDAMHDYLHETTEREARSVFVYVLSAAAQATRACAKKAQGEDVPGLEGF
jgi:hypothetical protein